MKLKDIALLSCKILSITVFIKFIYFLQTFGAIHAQKEFKVPNIDLTLMLIVPVLLLLISIILWCFANSISKFMVSDSVSFNKVINFKYNEIKPIVFSIIGIILLTQAIPSLSKTLINLIADILRNQGEPYKINSFDLGYLIENLLKILIAVYLIIGSKKVSTLIKSTRTLGLDEKKNNL